MNALFIKRLSYLLHVTAFSRPTRAIFISLHAQQMNHFYDLPEQNHEGIEHDVPRLSCVPSFLTVQ